MTDIVASVIPESLRSFGEKRGGFEIVDGSAIVLDEVVNSPRTKAEIAAPASERVFELRGGTKTIRVDASVIAPTNRPLAQGRKGENVRQDRFYRLDVFPIEMPLRDRREGIPRLSWTFVKRFSNSMGKPIDEIADQSMAALQEYHWPGNIR
jgi:formate hydrogenlyase transcriptional activator